jgi:hypothetical protein
VQGCAAVRHHGGDVLRRIAAAQHRGATPHQCRGTWPQCCTAGLHRCAAPRHSTAALCFGVAPRHNTTVPCRGTWPQHMAVAPCRDVITRCRRITAVQARDCQAARRWAAVQLGPVTRLDEVPMRFQVSAELPQMHHGATSEHRLATAHVRKKVRSCVWVVVHVCGGVVCTCACSCGVYVFARMHACTCESTSIHECPCESTFVWNGRPL